MFRSLDEANRGSWVRIQLKEGQRVIVGKFGTNSLASSDPTARDIYLEELWPVDKSGRPIMEAPPNRGAWIPGDQIALIEFF